MITKSQIDIKSLEEKVMGIFGVHVNLNCDITDMGTRYLLNVKSQTVVRRSSNQTATKKLSVSNKGGAYNHESKTFLVPLNFSWTDNNQELQNELLMAQYDSQSNEWSI